MTKIQAMCLQVHNLQGYFHVNLRLNNLEVEFSSWQK